MSDQTSQPAAAPPAVTESPAPAAVLIPPKLAVPVDDAAREIQNQLKIGSAIRSQRIRNRWELGQARTEKQEWVGRTTELLIRLFSGSTAIADECNDWVAPILPEFAEADMFIELFDNEMKHRIGRLKAVGKRLVENVPAKGSLMPTATVQANPVQPDSAEQETMILNPQSSPAVPAVPSAATFVVAPSPQAATASSAAAAPARLPTVGGALILRAADEQAKTRVSEFLAALGLATTLIDRTCEKPEKALIDGMSGSEGFAIVLADDATAPSDRELFELGVCVGRLGASRVCVLSRSNATNGDSSEDFAGVTHIPLDPADAWHLHLARHLRRGGIAVDLNKLA